MSILVLGISPGKAATLESSMSYKKIKNIMLRCRVLNFDWDNLSSVKCSIPSMKQVEISVDKVNSYDKVICLGNIPAIWCAKKKINHLKIPHPSGINRQWNNPDTEIKTVRRIVGYLDTMHFEL